MKVNVKEIFIHLAIGVFLFCSVFLAVFLGTKEIKDDISSIQIDIENIQNTLQDWEIVEE